MRVKCWPWDGGGAVGELRSAGGLIAAGLGRSTHGTGMRHGCSYAALLAVEGLWLVGEGPVGEWSGLSSGRGDVESCVARVEENNAIHYGKRRGV